MGMTILMGLISTVPAHAVFTNGSTTNSNYNRASAKSYIESYVTTPNKSYAWFGTGTDGGDCTNFVSQVLKAGGMPFTSQSSSPTTNHWYYYNSSWGTGRTATWTGAHQFRQYWADVNGVGNKKAYSFSAYSASELKTDNSKWLNVYNVVKSGDIIQFVDGSGHTYHSQVVHRTSYENGERKVSTAQHSVGERDNNPHNRYHNLRTYINGMSGTSRVCVIRIKRD